MAIASSPAGATRVGAHHPVRSDELVVAIVAPVGTETEKVWRSIRAVLGSYRYDSHKLKVSWFFDDPKVAELLPRPVSKETEFERLRAAMDAGDALRQKTGLNEAMALVACSYITEKRQEVASAGRNEPKPEDNRADDAEPRPSSKGGPLRRTAYLLHSIKRPEEVVYLRHMVAASS